MPAQYPHALVLLLSSSLVGCFHSDEDSLQEAPEVGDSDDGVDAGSSDPTANNCSVGCACVDSSTCDAGLECIDGTCQLPGADTTDTGTTGDLGDCDPANEYCLGNGCAGSMGASFLLDSDMDGNLDVGFCQFPCMSNDTSVCPLLDGAGLICATWNPMTMEGVCWPICELANDTCGSGMECFHQEGLGMGYGLCVSPVV